MKEASLHKEAPQMGTGMGVEGALESMESTLASGGQQNLPWVGWRQRRKDEGILGGNRMKSDLEPGPSGTC